MLSDKSRDSFTLGPWRRRRRMARLLAELDARDAGQRPHRAGGGDWLRKLAVALVALALIVSIGSVFAYKELGLTVSADGIHLPSPLGEPPEVAKRAGSYKFISTQPSSRRPVTYDPCRPIEYVVNDAIAPAGSDELLESSIQEISAATGLVFTYVGRTDEVPRQEPSGLVPRREPVIVAWTTPEAIPDLVDRVAGVGGSTARQDEYAGELEYITGLVALDAPQLTDVLSRSQGRERVQAIITHELGHLVGLDHVSDRSELMYPESVEMLVLGPGDREGLAALGSGSCFH